MTDNGYKGEVSKEQQEREYKAAIAPLVERIREESRAGADARAEAQPQVRAGYRTLRERLCAGIKDKARYAGILARGTYRIAKRKCKEGWQVAKIAAPEIVQGCRDLTMDITERVEAPEQMARYIKKIQEGPAKLQEEIDKLALAGKRLLPTRDVEVGRYGQAVVIRSLSPENDMVGYVIDPINNTIKKYSIRDIENMRRAEE